MDKTLRKVTILALKEQQAETYRYWQSVSPGDRLTAVSELSETAYAFNGVRFDGVKPVKTLVRHWRTPR